MSKAHNDVTLTLSCSELSRDVTHTLPLDELVEQLVDAGDVQTVLEALATVCYEKAEHVRSNWQDRSTAKTWEHAGKAIGALTVQASVVLVSQ